MSMLGYLVEDEDLAAILRARPIQTDTAGDVAVCICANRKEWKACLWALVSFYEFAQVKFPLVIYDDGTLSRSSHKVILELFPNASIVDRRCADLIITRALAEYPNCLRFRHEHPRARHTVDLPLLCGSRRILMLDDGVLFVGLPERLLENLRDYEPGQCVFGWGTGDSYACSQKQIFERLGAKVGERVNCEIMLADISEFSYELLEQWLHRNEIKNHSWMEQTLWAIYAGRGRTVFLERKYDVTVCPTVQPACFLKRFFRPLRKAIYSESISRVRRELENRGVFGR